MLALAREQIEGQRFRAPVDQLDRLLQILHHEHGQQRTEELLLHQRILRPLHPDQARRDPAFARFAGAAVQQLAPLPGPFQQTAQAVVLGLVHDAAQIGRAQRIRPEAFVDAGAQQGQQPVGDRTLHQQVVRSDAGLARIEGLAPNQAAGGHRQVGIRQHHRRALAAQFEGHGGEVLGRGGHHQPAHPFAASEEDVIEPLLQQRGGGAAIPLDHLHRGGREGRGDELGDQRGGGWGVLGGLEHRCVACCQSAHQRLQAEMEWIVPGADDQHAAERFGDHLGLSGLQAQGQPHPLWRHPGLEAAAAEPQLLLDSHQFVVGLHVWFAQIAGQGFQNSVAVLLESTLEALKLFQSPGQRPGMAVADDLA